MCCYIWLPTCSSFTKYLAADLKFRVSTMTVLIPDRGLKVYPNDHLLLPIGWKLLMRYIHTLKMSNICLPRNLVSTFLYSNLMPDNLKWDLTAIKYIRVLAAHGVHQHIIYMSVKASNLKRLDLCCPQMRYFQTSILKTLCLQGFHRFTCSDLWAPPNTIIFLYIMWYINLWYTEIMLLHNAFTCLPQLALVLNLSVVHQHNIWDQSKLASMRYCVYKVFTFTLNVSCKTSNWIKKVLKIF